MKAAAGAVPGTPERVICAVKPKTYWRKREKCDMIKGAPKSRRGRT